MEPDIPRERMIACAGRYLPAVREAGRIYRHIEKARSGDNFITEVSMDETDAPQTTVDLLFILAALAEEGIPAQTLAPKFSGRFNKGVDYAGDVRQFEKEFNADLEVLEFAAGEFGLPENLKLSIHSGSDKFSIYGPIRRALKRHDAGLHLKTAGTTWLAGLAAAGGGGLEVARRVYRGALDRYDELCGPYSAVIDIDAARLPPAREVEGWSGRQYAQALRHDPACRAYNPHFRRLLHVGYKIAAETGDDYLEAPEKYADVVAAAVAENIFERHIARVF